MEVDDGWKYESMTVTDLFSVVGGGGDGLDFPGSPFCSPKYLMQHEPKMIYLHKPFLSGSER